MKKIIICLLILALAACSNKKAPPDEEEKAPEGVTFYEAVPPVTAEIQKPQHQENRYVYDEPIWRGTYYEGYYQGSRFIAFLRGVEASSQRSDEYAALNLTDHSWRPWAEGSDGNGVEESISLTLRWFSNDTSEKTVAGFVLKNGHGNLDHYRKNNRVKSFKIYADEEYIETIPIKDSISFEQYVFEKPVACETVRFVINDVYPGTDFNDTYVSEIALLKQQVSENEFYENILIWMANRYEISLISYKTNSQQIVSVPDTDRLLLLDYLPFVSRNTRYDYETHLPKETKIALLGGGSSLKLSDNLPRLDGASAMYPLYSSFVRAVYPEVKINYSGENYAEYNWPYFPNLDLYDERGYRDPYTEFGSIVQCNKTSRAFQRLIDGETDIIFCYEPSTAEKNAAAKKGKRFNLTPIAHDAFVFIVNGKNSLSNITQRQIRDIYSGRVTNWKSISGVDELVIAYQRPENSGSQTTLQLIMQKDRLMRPILDSEYVVEGMSCMIQKVASDYFNYNSAIGYTFLFYLTQMAGDSGLKALSVDGIAPTRQTIQTKKYPFVQTVYAITTGNESENTKKFIAWILSAQGQELVAKTGYTTVK